jgi:hypothetical protein
MRWMMAACGESSCSCYGYSLVIAITYMYELYVRFKDRISSTSWVYYCSEDLICLISVGLMFINEVFTGEYVYLLALLF